MKKEKNFESTLRWIPLKESIYFEELASAAFSECRGIRKEEFKKFLELLNNKILEVLTNKDIDLKEKNSNAYTRLNEIYKDSDQISIFSENFDELVKTFKVPYISNLTIACKYFLALSKEEQELIVALKKQ